MKKRRLQKHRESKNVLLWDLDDVLMWTSWAYSRAFSKFYEYMLELFDFRLIELRTLGTISEEIDEKLVATENPETGKPYCYSMDRFPESLVQTYQWLCDHDFATYQEMVARRVRVIGREAFDPLSYKKQGLVKGAEETLSFIKEQGDIQILLTKGDRVVQECKIVMLELDRWFGEEIYIVDSKHEATFTAYKNKFPKSRVISVGNSYRSDIEPALKAGIEGIWIPYYTWCGEEPPKEIAASRVFKLKHITDIIGLYRTGQLR